MAAVISRADRGRRADDGERGAAHVRRARLIVNEAWRNVRRNVATVRSNLDDDIRAVASELTESGGAYLPGQNRVGAR
jgi:hypothetical protein